MRRVHRHVVALLIVGLLLTLTVAPTAGAEEVELVSGETPWRFFLTIGPRANGTAAEPKLDRPHKYPTSQLPPEDWRQADFDDAHWGRYSGDLAEEMGGYGYKHEPHWALLAMRTRFGVEDPSEAKNLKLALKYRGGVIVYVNGREVGRSHVPEGEIEPLAFADDYPIEAFVQPGGKKELRDTNDPEEHLDRYNLHIREARFKIPADALRKGANVLAVEVHRSTMRRGSWNSVAAWNIRLSAPSAKGVVPYADAIAGMQLWNAQTVATVAEDPAPVKKGWGTNWMALGPAGLRRGNPFDPLLPVRILAARGVASSGQIVLTAPEKLESLSATIGRLEGPGRATIPAGGVEIRYAHQEKHERAHKFRYCDTLSPEPDLEAQVHPVWVLIEIPRDQAPGWYGGTLTIKAGDRTFEHPVQVFVSGWTAPEPRENRTYVSLAHSPDTLAMKYEVEPLSEEHWRLLERTMKLLGQVGTDRLYVPIVHKTHQGHRTGFVRWVKKGDGFEPDYSALDRLMDLFEKYCGPPKHLCLIVWKPQYGEQHKFRGAQVKGPEPILVTRLDPQTGKMEPMEAPMYRTEGSEVFWRTMIDGVKERVKKRGWDDTEIILGQAFDSRPVPEDAAFLNKVSGGLRWVVFSHWIRDPAPKDGKLVLECGIEVGVREAPGGGYLPVLNPKYPDVPDHEFLSAGSHRMDIVEWSPPTSWRNSPNITGTWVRNGLDFWPVEFRRGRMRKIFNSGICGAWMYRGNPSRFVVPGPEGTLPTVRWQMFREGVWETEARIAVKAAMHKLPEAEQKPYGELLKRRRMHRRVAYRATQGQISLGWYKLTADMYAAAAKLAGEKTVGAWAKPLAAE